MRRGECSKDYILPNAGLCESSSLRRILFSVGSVKSNARRDYIWNMFVSAT
jgi:hypothetical protein